MPLVDQTKYLDKKFLEILELEDFKKETNKAMKNTFGKDVLKTALKASQRPTIFHSIITEMKKKRDEKGVSK